MTSSDTPENGKKPDDKADGTPEQVEAEIVDNDTASAKDDGAPLESETVSPGASEDKADGKGLGLMTPGMILLGLLAIVLVFVMLSQDNTEPQDASESVVTTAQENAEAGEDLLAAAGDDLISSVEQVTPPAQAQTDEPPVETTVSAADDAADEPVHASETQIPAEEPVADTSQTLSEDDQRRAGAIQRDRERREARNAALQPVEEATEEAGTEAQEAVETAAEESTPAEEPVSTTSDSESTEEEVIDADPQQPDETALAEDTEAMAADTAPVAGNETPETPAMVIAAEDVVTDEKLANQLADIKQTVKEDVLAETQAALAAEQERARRQEEELNALRQDFDSALALQEERSEEKIAELEERMDKLQNRDVAAATKQAAISIALSNLQRQMFTGAPFAEQLQILEGLVSPSPAIAELKPFAEEGLPTMLTLQSEFSQSARAALAEARRAEADGWLGQIGANLSGLFSVRKIDKIEGDTPSAMISRAEAYLEEGNLREALREIGELEGAPAEAMAPWMTKARSRVAADDLLSEVSTRVLIRLN